MMKKETKKGQNRDKKKAEIKSGMGLKRDGKEGRK